jgi:hypothetical protein
MRFLLIFSACCFLHSSCVVAQESNNDDSTSTHIVRNALVLSAIIPGAGQVYNQIHTTTGRKRAYWKVPLIYGSLLGSGFLLMQNQQQVNLYKREYSNRKSGGVTNPELSFYDDNALISLYTNAARNRDLSILLVGAIYLFQLADAGVEAHFIDFDVSPNLSLAFEPTILNRNSAGVSLQLNFR